MRRVLLGVGEGLHTRQQARATLARASTPHVLKEGELRTVLVCTLVFLTLATAPLFGERPAPPQITPNATVFIEPMGGFETDLAAAIVKKKTPLIVVDDKDKAVYILTGTSTMQKAGLVKSLLLSHDPAARASIRLKDSRTGRTVYAYTVDKVAANKGTQSTAEACAKHLKLAIEGKEK